MTNEEKEVNNIKAMIRAVLQSSKEGVQNCRLQRDYCEFAGDFIPFKKLGYGHLEEFIRSIPDVVTIKRNNAGEVMYHAVADESTFHIQRLISKQKSKKTKNRRSLTFPSRKPISYSPRWTPEIHRSDEFSRRRPYRAPHHNSSHHSKFEFYPPSPRRALEMPDNHSNLKVVVDNRRNSQRSVHIEEDKPSFHSRREDYRKKEAFNFSPRFLYQDTPKTTPVYRRHEDQAAFTQLTDEKMYEECLSIYCREKILIKEVKTMPARVGKSTGFVSTVKLQGVSYGSGDVFASSTAAEAAAYKTACKELGLRPANDDSQREIELSVPETLIKERIREILILKPNGLWSTRLPVEYKEKFQEDPPEDIIYLVKKWKNLARVEKVVNTEREIIYPVVEDPNKAKERIIPKGDVLPQGKKFTVYMAFMYSCGYFCVQKKDSVIDDIAEELESSCKNQPVPEADQIDKGCYCAAMYTSDGSWSRGEIIECYPSEKAFDVLYVDYGNMEKVAVKDIRWLSEKAAAFPAEVVNCSLFGLTPLDVNIEQAEGKWSDSSKESFAEMLDGKELLALVLAYDDDNVCEVELFDAEQADVSINQRLIDTGHVRDLYAIKKVVDQGLEVAEEELEDLDEAGPLLLPTDHMWGVYVGFVNSSLNHVFVRLVGEEYSEKLEKFESQLEEIFKSAPDDVQFNLGSVYIAYMDSNYHRVQLLAMDDNKWRCHFLDHGDCDELIPEQLKPLPVDVNKSLPYQAIEVSLYGLDEIAQDTTAMEKLFDTALGRTCVAEVVSREDPISVILYDTDGHEDVDLNDLIAKTVEKKNQQQEKKSETSEKADIDLNELLKELNEDTSLFQTRVDSSQIDHKDIQFTSVPLLEKSEKTISTVRENNKKETSVTLSNHALAGELKLTNERSSVIDSRALVKLDSIVQNSSVVDECTDKGGKDIYSWDRGKDVVSRESHRLTSDVVDKMNELKVDGEQGEVAEGVSDLSDDDLWDSKAYQSRSLPPDLQFPSVGEFMDVYVLNVTDPSNFQCIPYESMNDISTFLADLNYQFLQKPPIKQLMLDEVEENHLYAGLQENLWSRVVVDCIVTVDLVHVYLVDFGEYTMISLDELQPLPSKFWHHPFQAFKCKLDGISACEEDNEWSEGAKFKFIELAQEKSLVALYCGKDENGQICVKLIDTSVEDKDVCIHEVLVELNFAQMAGEI